MIVSHKHKFIYVKGRKVASTSTELVLSRICGDADVITSLPVKFEKIRLEIGGKQPQFYSNYPYEEARFNSIVKSQRLGAFEFWKIPILEAHSSLNQLVASNMFTLEQLKEYKVIGNARNPYDIVIAFVLWKANAERYKNDRPMIPFTVDKFRTQLSTRIKNGTISTCSSAPLYANSFGFEPTFFKYETLQQDINKFLLGLGEEAYTIPLTKEDSTDFGSDKESLLLPEHIEAINDLFDAEFKLYGYEKRNP